MCTYNLTVGVNLFDFYLKKTIDRGRDGGLVVEEVIRNKVIHCEDKWVRQFSFWNFSRRGGLKKVYLSR